MCRAVWVLVAAASEEACKALRRAAGMECQVVGMATSMDDVIAMLTNTPADCVVVDAAVAGARARAGEIADCAICWVGPDAPSNAHHAVEWGDNLNDILPGAIVKALLARKR